MTDSDADILFLRKAIESAANAEREGNLPIGAVISLEGRLIASGRNSIWSPGLSFDRHAEMEALRSIPPGLRRQYGRMTLYTTLEPCLMCAGAILLHRIGRVVFGAADGYGGVTCAFGRMPRYFEEALSTTQWIGPLLSEECDRLARRVTELESVQDESREGPDSANRLVKPL